MLIWAREMVGLYDECAARLDAVIQAWPSGEGKP